MSTWGHAFPSRFGVTLLKCILLCKQLKAWGSWPGLVLFVPPSCARIHNSGGFGTCGDKEPGCSFPAEHEAWPEGASGCAERGITLCVCVCVCVCLCRGWGLQGARRLIWCQQHSCAKQGPRAAHYLRAGIALSGDPRLLRDAAHLKAGY